jgi:L-threonylcarbamoyladenylate synthase
MVTVEEIRTAAEIIRSGGLVVFPTETVYGLGANACHASAVQKIFALKGRPASSPLIVHVASIEQARALAAEWPEQAQQLALKFWPGPLTIVVPKKPLIPDSVTAGLQTVGLRMPKNEIALALIRESGVPIAAPSANRFTQLSPTTAQHVRDAFGSEVPMILDGGPCEVGLESTVVAIVEGRVEIFRPGMLLVEQAIEVLPSSNIGSAHRSPGQHEKHYSPRTRLLLVTAGSLPQQGRGAYLVRKGADSPKAACERLVQMPSDAAEYAAQLYKTLHDLDREGFDWIAVELPPQRPDWVAILDRLRRAAFGSSLG